MSVVQKIRCEVEAFTPHGERVYSVVLKPERWVPKFRPGQFLHLALDPYDYSGFWPDSRVFSIASSPLQRDRIALAFSVRGQFTARMEKELAVGRSVWVKMPYGDFVVEKDSDAVLFAGGTGITAYTAFLESLTADMQCHVYLAYGARFRSLLIYREMVEKRSHEVPNFSVAYFLEEDTKGDMQSPDPVRLPKPGRLSAAAIWADIRDPGEAVFYLSGPPLMLKGLSKELGDLGIREARIKTDAWE